MAINIALEAKSNKNINSNIYKKSINFKIYSMLV